MRALTAGCTLLLGATGVVLAQDPLAPFRAQPRAQVLVLGVFHFQDAGLDAYKPAVPFDIRAPARQRELEDVLSRLAAWRPTRIAVERLPERQARLDSLFAGYPGGGTDTLQNEIYQIGFRLAKRLGIPRVAAIDAPARFLDSGLTREEWDRRHRALRQGPLSATDWDARFTALYRADDSAKAVRPLRETLLYTNSPERLAVGHGHYLVGDLLAGEPGEYFGADQFVSAWYNRNLRIYSNVVRLVRSPDERVLVIIGAGHAPILRHLLQSSPAVRLVEVSEVLR
ncbi:MAG: DUF5694 domain-containing protein [Gemmatimonadales bacterium]